MTKENSNTSIAIVGLGYVGLPLALLAASKGYQVTGVEINPIKVDLINRRQSPYADEALSELLKTTTLSATSEFSQLKKANIIIICVPTPVRDHHIPDLEPVRSACHAVAAQLQPGQLVILESTVNPGVCEEVVIPLLETDSGLVAGKNFYVAHCPERIDPGKSVWSSGYSVANIPRVVGSLESVGLEIAVNFYRSIIDANIKPMGSLKEAEAVKIVENSFRDVNLAFVNELAQSFSVLGIDIENVLDGAATKPYAFMRHYPGCGVGGHCIPVDPYYLIDYAQQHGFHHKLLSTARNINNFMPEFTVKQLTVAIQEQLSSSTPTHPTYPTHPLENLPITVLGLAYKANIDDTRESPSYEIIKLLKDQGAIVATYDPHVLKESSVLNLEQALTGAQAVIIATKHDEFKSLTPDNFLKYGIKIVIDGCNCLDKEAFLKSNIIYKGIGR